MELYIVRHGQTVWNKEKRLQGSIDIPLDKSGLESARNYGKVLHSIPFDKVFSSPLQRAYSTACTIFEGRNIEIVKDERLREISFGKCEGTTYSEWLKETSPHRFFFSEPDKYIPPENGESIEDLCLRTKDFLVSSVEPLFGKCNRIMIVAHGALNKGLMCYLENNEKAHFWGEGLQQNCQATVFIFDGKSWSRKK